MSSTSGESDTSTVDEELQPRGLEEQRDNEDESLSDADEDAPSNLADIVADEQRRAGEDGTAEANGSTFRKYTSINRQDDEESSNGTETAMSPRQNVPAQDSPEGSLLSRDDSPSIQDSRLSSPGSSVPPSLASSPRRTGSVSLQPFDRRFSASRLSPSPSQSPRPASPLFLSHRSRQSSLASNIFPQDDGTETPQAPWEVVRWTKLKKITSQIYSEAGKRNFGRPTCLAIAASVVIGTSKGLILVFDYQQTLKSIIGPGTQAVESGSVTSIAISADHSTIAGGHATGHIFTWDLSRPAKPFLHIPPLDKAQLSDRQSDGHIAGVAILHVGFLGTRHTALVSADDRGMAFSQLATRGLGAVGRTVKTARILGRYPPVDGTAERNRKPSSVLAFSPLPLGNVEQPTDGLGLTALLTPYLLVVVSTTPVAETQYKTARPKEITPHSAQSGCLAWFPAVKLRSTSDNKQQPVSKTKLVYCWSNILTILDVNATETAEKDKRPDLEFQPRSRWRSEEPIVAVSWLTRSVLAVLTISQRLVILEDNTLRVTDSFDLLHKHIFHQDLFSKQLRNVIERHDEADASMHGVVADAFYMSFRTYKGRLFILGFNDVSIGTLSNWADRLVALVEGGDSVAAITLATSYYNGDTDKLTVGLPEENYLRHSMVHEKLVDIMTASLKYTFSRNKNRDINSEHLESLKDLAEACFAACISMENFDFLFEDIYENYEEASVENIFFQILAPYILDGTIKTTPPDVLKDLINHFASKGQTAKLEQMICQLETSTMDLDQITTLCKQYNLYDALIYVWNQGLQDYITPLIDLLNLIKVVGCDTPEEDASANTYWISAMKTFPYLACVLTGKVYPSGDFLPDESAERAKRDMYGFLFAGKNMPWPEGSKAVILTRTDKGPEPSFPYLRMLLRFDCGSFMSMLNEAFEDSFLNGDQGPSTNGTGAAQNGDRKGSRLTPTRQYIVSILLEVVNTDDFDPEQRIYVHMFVARNLPKFPQFMMLPGSSLHKSLVALCQYPSSEVADDCELSVEYLLSIYQPPDLESLVPLFQQAGFYRVLKSVHRSAKNYPKLLETYLEDMNDREATFDCIADCLRPSRGLSRKQINEIHKVILNHADELAEISASTTAEILHSFAPDLLQRVCNAIDSGSQKQYVFLKTLLEPSSHDLPESDRVPEKALAGFIDQYVQLMCSFDPTHVADYIGLLKAGDLHLSSVLPAMEEKGVVDAAVVLLARDGLVNDAMDRLMRHLGTLETALTGLVRGAGDTPDAGNTEEAVEDLLAAVQKYSKVGIWLCQGQSKTMSVSRNLGNRRLSTLGTKTELDADEQLWLELTDKMIVFTKNVTTASNSTAPTTVDANRTITTLRSSVQQIFTSLLTATSQPAPSAAKASAKQSPKKNAPIPPSFLPILRALLTRLSKSHPTLEDLRTVLSDIFSTYAFESTILSLASRFLDKDSFSHVASAHQGRISGWRPKGQACEVCKRRAWGPGVGSGVWSAWEGGLRRELARKKTFLGEQRGPNSTQSSTEATEGTSGKGKGKGKVKAGEGEDDIEGIPTTNNGGKGNLDRLLLFACRHMFHAGCLTQVQDTASSGTVVDIESGAEHDARGKQGSSTRETAVDAAKRGCPLCP